jgi:general stress protein 26
MKHLAMTSRALFGLNLRKAVPPRDRRELISMPVTTLDPRFSDENAPATGWEETRQALETAEVWWVTTVRSDGRPHTTPLVAVWVGEALYFCTGDSEQKAVNLRGNPHVNLTTGCNSWDSGLDIVVEGDAVAVTDQDVLRDLAEAWTRRWDGRWQFQVGDGGFKHPDADDLVLVFKVAPTKVMAFAKGNSFSYTKHSF